MSNPEINPEPHTGTSLAKRLVLLFRLLMVGVYFGLGAALIFEFLGLVEPLNNMGQVFGAALVGFGLIRSFRLYKSWHYRDF